MPTDASKSGTRRIGLSLGADSCWPQCYEEILKRLDLNIRIDGEDLRFEVERVMIEPFDIRQPCPYDLVIDRLTHWYHVSREWIKKSILLDNLYVFNNPWSLQSMEKQTTYCAMIRLGFPVPETWMVPPKAYDESPDLQSTLQRYARLFDLGETGRRLGYPMYMKPYDGGAWKGVSRIENEEALRAAYEQSGKLVMHLQESIEGFDRFIRCVGLGPQFRLIHYDPSAPLHNRYCIGGDVLEEEDIRLLQDMTLTINAFFGWDFNSCEALRRDGTWYPIDFANACPDSQVTSLHYHFPWMVIAHLRWSLFCAATRRPMRLTLDWEPFFELRREGLPFRQQVAEYAKLSRKRMQAEAFEQFCDDHLGHLETVAREFFGTDEAREAVRGKVHALYPEHEVETFTDIFWDRIQQWRGEHAEQESPV